MGRKLHIFIVILNVILVSATQITAQDVTPENDLSVIPLKKSENDDAKVAIETVTHENLDEYDSEYGDIGNMELEVDNYDDNEEFTELEDETLKLIPNNFITRFNNFTGKIVTMMINITLDLEEYKSIFSENYPNPYPTTEATVYEWFIGLGEGYGVEMIITSMDLAESDYVLIKPGNPEHSADRQIVISRNFANEKKYKLFHLDEMYLAFVVNQRSDNTHVGFQIDFRRVGLRPTTEPPTTTEELPVTVAPMNESTIYLGGLSPSGFMNVSEQFKSQLAYVAEIYCLDNNITIDENISISDNVKFQLVGRCMLDWPNSRTCTRIVYSIGVSYDNVTDEYELSETHLDDMWINYRDHFNLTGLGLYVYTPPDDGQTLMVWLLVSGVIVLLFGMLLFLTARYNCFSEYSGRESLRASLMSQKLTNASLFPTPHQTVPPFYGMDYYSPEDDQFWAKDEELPPKYSGDMMGERNAGFVHDDEILDLYSEELVMSLPDGREQIQYRTKNTHNNAESSM